MNSTGPTRVVVIGARGIGKHHAKWWAIEGAEVCAIVGTSAASVAETADALRALFPFRGKLYTDVDTMLKAEKPDIVDVCSPPDRHYEHAKSALEAGCAVLCEKPLLFKPGTPAEALIAQARELADIAGRRQLRFGLCAQYHVAGTSCRRLHETHCPGQPITSVMAHLASPARGRPADPMAIWVDLAPHMVAVLRALFPAGCVGDASIRTEFAEYDAKAQFTLALPDGQKIDCRLRAGRTQDGPSHIRSLQINETVYHIEGDREPDGSFCARIDCPHGAFRELDMMRALIRRFLAGECLIDAPAAVANLECVLRILSAASRTA